MDFPSYLDSLSSGIRSTKTTHGISMKLYSIVHKNLIYHMKGILWPENKIYIFYLLLKFTIAALCSKSREKVKNILRSFTNTGRLPKIYEIHNFSEGKTLD